VGNAPSSGNSSNALFSLARLASSSIIALSMIPHFSPIDPDARLGATNVAGHAEAMLRAAARHGYRVFSPAASGVPRSWPSNSRSSDTPIADADFFESRTEGSNALLQRRGRCELGPGSSVHREKSRSPVRPRRVAADEGRAHSQPGER
jgi:hypothetical protein